QREARPGAEDDARRLPDHTAQLHRGERLRHRRRHVTTEGRGSRGHRDVPRRALNLKPPRGIEPLRAGSKPAALRPLSYGGKVGPPRTAPVLLMPPDGPAAAAGAAACARDGPGGAPRAVRPSPDAAAEAVRR